MRKFKTVLITGITGFVGSHLADYILENKKGVRIIGLVRWRSPKENIKHILGKVSLEYGDLIDQPSVLSVLTKHRPDVIFHLAAQSYVDFSFLAPIATLEANVIGTANLLEVVKKLKQDYCYDPIVHICSSSEVYGQVKKNEIPIKEISPLRPASPYAVSKVAEDMLGLQYFLSWNIKTVRTRMFTHTGPRRGEVFAESNFAKQIASIEAGFSPKVIYVGNLESVRTFADVRDTVRAYWLLIDKGTPGEVYNIGGIETMKVGRMLEILLSKSHVKKIKIKVDQRRLRPSDVTLQIPDITKFVKATGWKPKIKFEKTLEDLLNFWRGYFKARE
jgi:GDP-mannose 4,6-dehydratase